jgi:hypothetical protein
MFMASFFVIIVSLKQSKCLSTVKQIQCGISIQWNITQWLTSTNTTFNSDKPSKLYAWTKGCDSRGRALV